MADHPGWYHTIDLLPGLTTSGYADLRRLIRFALPATLRGKRCLDVGVFDGFWSFAMEDRGAEEVVGIDVDRSEDLDHPPLRRAENIAAAHASKVVPGEGFALAARIRDSRARRVSCNVRDLDTEIIGGPVDFVLVGAILQHLRDPVGALERIREVLAPDGYAVLVETVSLPLTLAHPRRPVGDFRAASPTNHFTWWAPNLSLLKAWPAAAGLRPTRRITRLHRVGGAGPGDRVAVMPATR